MGLNLPADLRWASPALAFCTLYHGHFGLYQIWQQWGCQWLPWLFWLSRMSPWGHYDRGVPNMVLLELPQMYVCLSVLKIQMMICLYDTEYFEKRNVWRPRATSAELWKLPFWTATWKAQVDFSQGSKKAISLYTQLYSYIWRNRSFNLRTLNIFNIDFDLLDELKHYGWFRRLNQLWLRLDCRRISIAFLQDL